MEKNLENLTEESTEEKEKPAPEWDDGRTVADMDISGFKWYSGKSKKAKTEMPLELSSKEKWALFFGGMKAVLPMLFCALGALTLTFLLIFLWLN